MKTIVKLEGDQVAIRGFDVEAEMSVNHLANGMVRFEFAAGGLTTSGLVSAAHAEAIGRAFLPPKPARARARKGAAK